jgi:uncharacterized membrane protein YhdT
MNISPESYAEICKQLAFISALLAGFSFTFIGVLLTHESDKKIINWVIGFSISSIAGFLVCALAWTLSASRMAIYGEMSIKELPVMFINMHRILSFTFILCFFLFVITLGLSGWIRSRILGIISSIIALFSAVFFIWLLSNFMK